MIEGQNWAVEVGRNRTTVDYINGTEAATAKDAEAEWRGWSELYFIDVTVRRTTPDEDSRLTVGEWLSEGSDSPKQRGATVSECIDLDQHAQRCEMTSMLGCPTCILWLKQETEKMRDIVGHWRADEITRTPMGTAEQMPLKTKRPDDVSSAARSKEGRYGRSERTRQR